MKPKAIEFKHRSLPQALEAEEGVLSASMLGGHTEALKLLSQYQFYKVAHQKLFLAISELANQDAPITIESVCMLLRSRKELEACGGGGGVAGVGNGPPRAAA